jgi:hypothetical protein
LELGVDGIMTDYPQRLLELIKKQKIKIDYQPKLDLTDAEG